MPVKFPFWFPPTLLFHFWSVAAITFVFLYVSLKPNVEMFAQHACPRWASRVNSSPHVANHYVFTMYPVWTQLDEPKSLPYSHSVKMALTDHMNAQSASSDHIKTVLIIRSFASTVPSVPSCGGFAFNYLTSQDPHLQTTVRLGHSGKVGTCIQKEEPKPFTHSHTVGQCETPGPLLHLQNKSPLFSSSICVHSVVSHITQEMIVEKCKLLIQK